MTCLERAGASTYNYVGTDPAPSEKVEIWLST